MIQLPPPLTQDSPGDLAMQWAAKVDQSTTSNFGDWTPYGPNPGYPANWKPGLNGGRGLGYPSVPSVARPTGTSAVPGTPVNSYRPDAIAVANMLAQLSTSQQKALVRSLALTAARAATGNAKTQRASAIFYALLNLLPVTSTTVVNVASLLSNFNARGLAMTAAAIKAASSYLG